MNNNFITVRTPGKLMLAGEWNVLEPGHTCISLAINRFITVTLRPALTWQLTSSLFHEQSINFAWNPITGITLTSNLDTITQQLCVPSFAAINYALTYVTEHGISITPGWLHIDSSELYQSNAEKFGFGSSAAISVALIKSIIMLHNPALNTPEIIFKLAYLAHYQAQGNCGSGFDNATASLGCTVIYQSPDSPWLIAQYNNKTVSLATLITSPWPELLLKACKLPATLFINVGYSGTGAHTPTLIAGITAYKKSQPNAYTILMNELESIVRTMIPLLATQQIHTFMELIREYRNLMRTLSLAAGIELETASLTRLIETAESCGAAAKFSGAGGGDCGIAISNSAACYNLVENAWACAGISKKVSQLGISIID